MAYDPDNWLVSLFRELKAYVDAEVTTNIYDIQFSYPDISELAQRMPFEKTILAFEVDDIAERPFGMGDNFIDGVENLAGDEVENHEALIFEVNFDVSVWASAPSGGVTSRLEAYQLLADLFSGNGAVDKCRTATGGVEIRSFTRGRFITDKINDQAIFRIVDTTLVVRVYARRVHAPAVLVDEIIYDPELVIDGSVPIVFP